MRKIALLLVLFVWTVSAACGGSGSTSTSFVIGDFEGTWEVGTGFIAKPDSEVDPTWWFTVDSDGDIVPEPQFLSIYPKVVGGHLSLSDATTGAFTATVIWKDGPTAEDTSIPFEGTMGAGRNSLAIVEPTTASATRVTAVADAPGTYSVDRFPNNPFYRYDATELMTLEADGTLTATNTPGTGQWWFFRDRFVGAQMLADTNDDEVNDATIHIVFQLGSFTEKPAALPLSGMGEYTVVSNGDGGDTLDSGDITLYHLNMSATNFTTSDIASTWTVYGRDYSGDRWQQPAFVIETTGVPAQGNITGGTIDSLNAATGRYQMTVVSTDGTQVIRGYLSGSRQYGSALQYDPETEEETGTVTFVDELNTGFGWQNRAGDWHIGLYKPISEDADNTVINFTSTANGQIGAFNSIHLEGTITFIGYNTVSILLQADSAPRGGSGSSVSYWAVGSFDTGTPGGYDSDSYFLVKDSSGRFEDTGVVSRMQSYTHDDIRSSLAGHYSYAPGLPAYMADESLIDHLWLYRSGSPWQFDYINDSQLLFNLVPFVDGGKIDPEIVTDLVFFSPIELKSHLGFQIYSDNMGIAGRSAPQGEIMVAGANNWGQLGTGDTAAVGTPIRLPNIPDAVKIATNERHTLVIRHDGSVIAWGDNSSGQLGDDSFTTSYTPVSVSLPGYAVEVAAGTEHSLALMADGTVNAWGRNDEGQLGNGSTVNSNTPYRVEGLNNIVAIAAGEGFSVAVDKYATIYAWGHNSYGQIGRDSSVAFSTTPVVVANTANVYRVVCGYAHALALGTDGLVRVWGSGGFGALGLGDRVNRYSPEIIAALANVTQIACGANFSLALLDDGTVRSWGVNVDGILGDGTNADQTSPVLVLNLSGVSNIWARASSSMAMKSDGTIWGWGYGMPLTDITPSGGVDILDVACGYGYYMFLVPANVN